MTSFADVTPERALSTLREVVAGNEDHVYAAPEHQNAFHSCFYVHTDPENYASATPGCLAAQVLNKLGMSLGELQAVEGTRALEVVRRTDFNSTRDTSYAQYTPPRNVEYLAQLLDCAQQVQDNGGSWGEALRRAEAVTPESV